MVSAEHRIGRVVFDIAASDRAAFERFGETIRAHFDAIVVPALQAALDRIDRPGTVVRLGRVEVDLGTLDSAALSANELARRIADGLADTLRAAPPPLKPRGAAHDRDDADELAAFLETGELPWSEPGRALATLIATLMALDASGMARLAVRLRTVLIRRRAAERLVRQLPAALVRRLFRAMLPDAVAMLLAAAFGPDVPGPAPSAALVPDRLVRALSEAIHRLATGAGEPDLGDVLALYSALDSRAPIGITLPPAATTRRTEPEPAKPPAPSGKRAPNEQEADEAEPDEGDAAAQSAPRPVHAAGAVLLHPFLGTFFDKLGLLKAPDRFRDQAARARAVLLAHHLATGAEDAPEPETTLFKLLCGMDFSVLVPRRIELTDAERAEAGAVLDSVISHWKRLGNTSPAGLREGFLTRPGRLDRQGAQWRLTVEPRGIDVLLDGLPWTLSRVKTPYMQTQLAVDWR